jgi:hypothetical protein
MNSEAILTRVLPRSGIDLPGLAAAPPSRAYNLERASSRRLYQVPYATSAGVNQRIRGELLHIRVRNRDYPNSQLSALGS